MIERHRIYILIANPIRNLLFTKVSRAINLPTQTETPQPDVVPSEESDMLGSSQAIKDVEPACIPCKGINMQQINNFTDPIKYKYRCPFGNGNEFANYSPNSPSNRKDTPSTSGGYCPIGLPASFFQLVQSEGATGGSVDPWCASNTYCFSQEQQSSGPGGGKYALIRKNAKPVEKDGKLEAQTITGVRDGKNLGAIIPNKKWQSISCEVDGWWVYWKLNSSNCLTAFWDNWLKSDGIYYSCICTDPKPISSTTKGTVQKNAQDDEKYFIYPDQFYYETESEPMSCYFSYDGEFFYIFYSDGSVHPMNKTQTIQLKDSTISMDLLINEISSAEATYEVTSTNTT